MKLRKLLSEYRRARRVRPKTVEHRLGIINTFESTTGVTDTDGVTYEVLCQWRNDVIERASPATWDNYFKGLRTLWNFGMQEGFFERNPFALIKREKLSEGQPKTVDRALIADAIDYLMGDDEPQAPGWFWALVVRTFYYTGMRRNQMVSLCWGDLNADYTQCTLTATHIQGREKCTAALLPEIGTSLRDLHKMTGNILGRVPFPDEQVYNVTLFYDRYLGHEMTTAHVAGAFRRLSDAMSVKITPQRLRDTMAVTLIKETKAILPVSQILGHQDGRATLRYVPPGLRDQYTVPRDIPSL